jgi:ABC-type Fe3+-hydroxamate transport system substrate-binding protein
MKDKRTTWIVAALLVCACACKSESANEPKTETKSEAPLPSGTLAEGTATVTATVESIDLPTRVVTLRGPDGNSVTLRVDESARNLSQVKKGDRVVAKYHESLAYQVKKAGTAEPGIDVVHASGRAEPGEKPGAAAAGLVTATVTITAIDKTKPSITLKKADGSTFTVAVRHPEKLDQVKVGDLIELTYATAVAVSVEPAKQY